MLLVIGDSISAVPYSFPGLSAAVSWPEFMARQGWDIHSVSVAGSKLEDWAQVTYIQPRVDGYNPRGVIVALGTNDLTAGKTLLQMQTSLATLKTNIRTYLGAIPIYVTSILPMGGTAPQEAIRLAYNAGVRLEGLCIDWARFIDPSDSGTLPAGFQGVDNVHPNLICHLQLSLLVAGTVHRGGNFDGR